MSNSTSAGATNAVIATTLPADAVQGVSCQKEVCALWPGCYDPQVADSVMLAMQAMIVVMVPVVWALQRSARRLKARNDEWEKRAGVDGEKGS